MKNVVGVDIKYDPPIKSDIIIDNSKNGLDVMVVAEDIYNRSRL